MLSFTKQGIFCKQANVYIDPWKPVERAIISHGHSDHARRGHKNYLCVQESKEIIRHRLGKKINIDTLTFGERRTINGVTFSFHPAGHIIGSAQIRVEYKGEIWVFSGDYKTEDDGISGAFEPIPCHAFITESTFGLPFYQWQPQHKVAEEINNWWRLNKVHNRVSLLAGYSLGKAQRLIHLLDDSIGKIYTNDTVEDINEIVRMQGVPLKATTRIHQGMKAEDFVGNIIIAPSSALHIDFEKANCEVSEAVASGWMAIRKMRINRKVDRGFVLSDHADWPGLNAAIRATGAEHVFVTHGYTNMFSKWLCEQGINAIPVSTKYVGELLEKKS